MYYWIAETIEHYYKKVPYSNVLGNLTCLVIGMTIPSPYKANVAVITMLYLTLASVDIAENCIVSQDQDEADNNPDKDNESFEVLNEICSNLAQNLNVQRPKHVDPVPLSTTWQQANLRRNQKETSIGNTIEMPFTLWFGKHT